MPRGSHGGLPRVLGRWTCCGATEDGRAPEKRVLFMEKDEKKNMGICAKQPPHHHVLEKKGGTWILIKMCFYLEMSGYCRRTYETKQEHFIEGHL